ncbi:class I SAM-dependent methyltransferase [Sulfurimonas autotrophica]|uniref:2-polyprenyl-3-methyl-5-hydroxy-6-metoxy-1,4-ben zoquinolmethylase n=1 Tax=Sulfurimonas autotrophica (strain ATCC BAA-671 / DSM 16294 / JCM 11897 / OK10) TaxID=563040 RepID=E0UTT9_SULAO|nr:class I SAM-dependent methyltransferase [Sulfurimonas autotrophica]ADN09383.1 2-polyprenyl-3-methyl-5-hydroxy-6-metoxy-1,4-ben zoquinolmethylase [Sulfurimonas autotrophica DSM 16294]
MIKKCPLCQNSASFFYKESQSYFTCKVCHGIFVDEAQLPDEKSEKERYELHDDNADDAGYRKFVSPITSNIERSFTKEDEGLDFGAGTSRIITKVMQEKGYDISAYDPYFHPEKELLEKKYDYIASCEVIEHFYHPAKEFELLKSLLKKDAKLFLMTDIYDERIEFSSWYYKNDPTHVFFYTKKTFEWIQQRFEFSNLLIEKRLITLSN